MLQRMLIPRTCNKCKKDYHEAGYDGDGLFCLPCSIQEKREEEERRKLLAKQAADIALKYNLDLEQYADELPTEIRQYLNPKNAGRKPVKYRPEYCELLIKMAADGASEAEFAARIGISQSLITYWTETRPKFKQARETANEQRTAWYERFIREAMTARVPCNSGLAVLAAKVKLGWTDKNETAIKVAGGEIPVVKIVERDGGFPSEKLEPTAEQLAEAGLDKAAV